mgnify:CR=1 FL=1
MLLEGKNALVTGGSQGIGAAAALELARGRGAIGCRDGADVRRLRVLVKRRRFEVLHTWHTRDHVLALRAARNIGIRVPKSTIDRAARYVVDSAVTEETLQRAEESGLRVACLPRWYDVDVYADVQRLAEELRGLPEEQARRLPLDEVVVVVDA